MSDLNDHINSIIEGSEEAVPSEDEAIEDIHITVPREPEVNPELYRDVESLLFRGFLLLPAEINGVQFIFKSINHHEFEYLQWISGSLGGMTGKSLERYYNAFMAYGVFMLDGENLLPLREQFFPKLQNMFSEMPALTRGKIIRYLSEVNQKASNAVVLAEAYQTEQYSRFKWAQFRGLDLMSPSSTGILGTNQLGANYAQLVWRSLNHFDDLRETAEREWDNAKFIGSCFAGKGIQKIYSQDKDRRIKEREERVKRRDQLIRQVVYREDPDKTSQDGKYVMTVAKSVEELADQLEKGLRGEKDWHDEIVAREEERIKEQIRGRQVKLQDLIKEREEKQATTPLVTRPLEGLTREEVQQRIERRRQLLAQETASAMVYPELQDERVSNFYEKYLDSQDASYTSPKERETESVPLLPPTRPTAVPFRR